MENVAEPIDSKDTTTKAYVDEKVGHHTITYYHLRQSFEFYESSDNKLVISTDNIKGLLSDYKHGYYKIAKGGDEITYSYVQIKINNNLPKSTYSALFYLYGYNNNSLITGQDLGPILYGVDGTNYNILKYDDDDDSEQTKNHTKGIIWFTADGAGRLDIELRFFDKSITHFVILSRCVEGKVNLGFSIDIFNITHNNIGTFYFEYINMNNRKIKNLGDPTDNGDAINKSYIDGEIANLYIKSSPLLPRDGSRTMTGDLNMNENHILSIKNLTYYQIYNLLDSDYRVKDLKSAVNKGYLNENFLKKVDKNGKEYYDLKGQIIKNCEGYYDGLFDDNTLVSKAFVDAEISKLPKPATDVLKLDGSKAMIGNLKMGNNEIKNLKYPQPSDASYAASVDFVDNTIGGNNSVINNIIEKKIRRKIYSISTARKYFQKSHDR